MIRRSVDKTPPIRFSVNHYATSQPPLILHRRNCTSVSHELRNRFAYLGELSRDGASPEQSFGCAGKSFAGKAKRLRNGRGPLSDGGSHDGRHSIEADTERQFQHLFETGAQTFRIVRIQRARRSNSSFYWRWAWALCRISDGILVRVRSCVRVSSRFCASHTTYTWVHPVEGRSRS